VELLRGRVAALVIPMVVAVAVALLPVTVAGAATPRVAHCGGSGTEPTPPVAQVDEAAGVTQYEYTFVDRSRGTPALGDRRATDCRTLPVVVRFSAGDATPQPMVLLVHGADGSPSALASLADVWAAAGYVVVQPHFPANRKQKSGKAVGDDLVQQARDARFVLDEVLDRSASTTPGPLQGRVDPNHIGAAGMSLGGQTVYGMISHTCCRDGRIGAAVVMAGVHDPFPQGSYVKQQLPVLLVQGNLDVGYHHSLSSFPALAPPKWFVTLLNERHSEPFEVPRDTSSGIVDSTTVAFWDQYLRGDLTGGPRIVAAVQANPGKASLETAIG
jgi:predicted dienelactone hydrolase